MVFVVKKRFGFEAAGGGIEVGSTLGRTCRARELRRRL